MFLDIKYGKNQFIYGSFDKQNFISCKRCFGSHTKPYHTKNIVCRRSFLRKLTLIKFSAILSMIENLKQPKTLNIIAQYFGLRDKIDPIGTIYIAKEHWASRATQCAGKDYRFYENTSERYSHFLKLHTFPANTQTWKRRARDVLPRPDSTCYKRRNL